MILTEGPQHRVVGAIMPFEILRGGQNRREVLCELVAAPSAIGASIRVYGAIQGQVVGYDEERGLLRVEGASTAPLHSVVEGAEEAKVPRQE
jgi:hypothetical protein